MGSLNELKNVYNESAKIQVLTAQVKMLIEILALTNEVDIKTELIKYIKQKEKELDLCDK